MRVQCTRTFTAALRRDLRVAVCHLEQLRDLLRPLNSKMLHVLPTDLR